MCNISCKLDIFFVSLLILLVSILISDSNRFVCCFRLLKFTLRKNRSNTVYTGDSIQQERLSVTLEVGRIYFNLQTYPCKDICCKRNNTRTSTSLSNFCQSSVTPPLPSVKTIENLRQIRKFKYADADVENGPYLVY